MFNLFYITILLSFISVSFADKKIQSCKCLAHLDVSDGLSDENRLRTLDITEQLPNFTKCDNRGEFMCKSYCKAIFKVESNNFDLNKPPYTNYTVTITLGQYLCNVVHRDISSVLLGMTSELSCVSTDSVQKITTSRLKIFCDKRLTCLKGQYVNK